MDQDIRVTKASIVGLLAADEADAIDFDPPRLDHPLARPADFAPILDPRAPAPYRAS